MLPIVSIITPSFNRAYIIDETANSIFKQTYPFWEWIIVDDGSTDNSWDLIQKYVAIDKRVKGIKRNRGPKGACACRNIGVENCTGEYVIFLDTDDLLASFCLEQRIEGIMKNLDCDFVIFPMLLFNKNVDDLKLLWNIETGQDDLSRILVGDPICQGTGTIWKRKSFRKVGMWREDLQLWQDIELHIRSILFPMRYKKLLDFKPDVFLRISPDSLSRVGYFEKPKIQSRVIVFTETYKRIIERGLLTKYNESLRIMCLDIIIGAIQSRCYTEVREVNNLVRPQVLFKQRERILIFAYKIAWKAKLYKLRFLFNLVERELKKMNITPKSTLGRIKLNGHIKL